MNRVLSLKKSNCKNCYKCIRNCPVKSIKFEDGQAHILPDECILCGRCFVACPQDAKQLRSDVERVETPDARTFREYTKGGYVTNFTIIGEEPCRRWEFTMDNDNMTGRWVGAFRQRGAATVVDFTE